MKITRIDTLILKAPLTSKEKFWSSQATFPERKCLLVRVETDAGIIGWGEGGQYGPAEPVASQIHDVFVPLLLGKDPLQPAVHWERMYNHTRDFGAKGTTVEAISGIDIALWDVLGKARQAPVYQLMGGAFRREVQTYATGLYYRGEEPLTLQGNLPLLKEEAARYRDAGFPAVKAKIGILTPPEDVERVAVTRDVVGKKMLIMVDANHAYNAHVASQVAKAIEPLGIYWFEEPVVPEDLAGYQQVKASTTIAIAGGECEHTRYGFAKWFAERAIDIVQPDTCAAGGLTELRRIVAMASAFHVQSMPHVWGSGVSIAAGLQLLATIPPSPHTAIPHAPYNEPMLEWDGGTNPLRTDLLKNPLHPKEGRVRVPEGPGLGVEIDMAVLEKYLTVSRSSAV
jgi:D-galactarolactone cycloisomerase